jgi:predicted nuclease of predicted toxin-antitoxin system
MKFLLDANIPYSALEIFKKLRIKAMHVNDVGLSASTDDQIVVYALKAKCIIVTRDLDFGTLVVFSKMATYGVVTLRLPFSFNAVQIKSKLSEFLNSVDLKKLRGSVTTVELSTYRVRKL